MQIGFFLYEIVFVYYFGFITFIGNMETKNMRLFVIVLTVLMLRPACAGAHRVYTYSRSFTVQEGVASNQIYGIVQDASGFIWFGTNNGLSRFDGTRFLNYRTGSGNNLSGDSILDLEIDDRGCIWLTLDNGVDIYDPDLDDFRHFDARTADGISVRGRTIKVVQDSDGEIWISTVEQGLFRYSPASETLTLYRHDPNDEHSIAQNYISVIYESSDGTIWLGTYDQGLCSFSKTTDRFTRYRACPGGLSDNSIDALTEDSNGNLWIGTVNSGIDCLDRRTGTFTHIDNRKETNLLHRIHYLAEIAPGELLVCSRGGASVFRIVENRLALKEHDGSSFSGGKNRNVYTCLRDRDGNIWLGSYYDGVEFYSGHNRFVYYHTGSTERSDQGREVYAVCPWRGNLYLVGTECEIMLFDLGTGRMEPFRTLREMTDPIYSMLVDDDRLWMAAYQSGVRMVDLNSGAEKTWLADGDSDSPRVFSVFRSSSGRIYAGTARGLYGYGRTEDRFELLRESSRVCDIEEDRNSGLLWVATAEQGLYSYDVRTGRSETYLFREGDPRSLACNSVNALAVDASKRLWVGTERGLCRYDAATDDFVRYADLELPNNNIKHLVPDGDRLWITTANGLAVLNVSTGSLRSYRHTDGLSSPMFNSNSGVCSPNGQMLLGTADGLCVYSSRETIAVPAAAPVVITDLLIDGERMRPGTEGSPLEKSIVRTRGITLSPNKSFIGLRFISPGCLASDNIRFRFRLDGNGDESWHTINDGNTTVYYKLRPGKYLFRVQAAVGSDAWSLAETTLAIRIRPPFLRSGFALAVYLLLILVALFVFVNRYRLRLRRQYRENMRQIENEREHELYRTRINFLTGIAHEIRTPLTLIVGPLEYIMRNCRHDERENEYLRIIKNSTDRLLDLINQLLDFRKANVEGNFTIHFDECDVSRLIDDQVEMFRFPAGKKGIEIRSVHPEQLPMVSDPEMLTKILGNLLSNAVRFARRNILVSAARRDDGVVLEVSDDGAGIPEEHRSRVFELFWQAKTDPAGAPSEGLGVGLNLVQTLVSLLGGTIGITEGPERPEERSIYTGATFSVFIPDSAPKEAGVPRTPAENPAEDAAATPPLPSERPVVLIVEDNAEMRNFLAEYLDRDYAIRQAADGEQALAMLSGESDIDLIVSDIMMPGIDGIEFCRRVKDDVNISHIPVILLSAKTDAGSKIAGLEFGADAYIEKPFSPEHLKAQIASLFRKRSALHDAYARMPISQIRTMAQGRRDTEFLDACRRIVVANMSNSGLSVDFLAAEMGLSRTAIFKKLKALTGMTPNDFMKSVRLDEASRMLVEGRYSITEIGFVTGFSSSSYFAKCFAKQFGVLPSEYVQNAGGK